MKIASLKILTDENISPRIVSFLRQKGLDVVDVKERGWHGNEDKYLMVDKDIPEGSVIVVEDTRLRIRTI